jgi:hypothetical protein
VRYPFDEYLLKLGIILRRNYPDGSVQTLSQDGSPSYLSLSMHEEAPRIRVDSVKFLRPNSVPSAGPQYAYASVSLLKLVRPLTTRILAIELVLLVSAAAAYAVFLQSMHDLLNNAGTMILGIWGIRAILLGPNVPGLTSIDLALGVVIVLLLSAITVRMLIHVSEHDGANLHKK